MAKVDMTMVPVEYVAESGRYKPGHDAKHVSQLVAEAKEQGFKVAVLRDLKKQLPTDSLKEKFEKAVERKKAEPEKKVRAPREPKAETAAATTSVKLKDLEVLDPAAIIRSEERPDIKLGRNFYPARNSHTQDGNVIVEVNSSKDGSGQWVIAPENAVPALVG